MLSSAPNPYDGRSIYLGLDETLEYVPAATSGS
jgi:hypothetical protein